MRALCRGPHASGDRDGPRDGGKGTDASRHAGPDEAGKRVPWFAAACEGALRDRDLLLHGCLAQVPEKFVLAGIAPVQAAHADACLGRDGAHGRVWSMDREYEPGRIEHGIVISPRFRLAPPGAPSGLLSRLSAAVAVRRPFRFPGCPAALRGPTPWHRAFLLPPRR